MKKITLLVDSTVYLPFCLHWTLPLVSDFFDIQRYDSGKTYDKLSTICYVSYINPEPDWIADFKNSGYRVLVDHLWDGDVDTVSTCQDHQMILRNPNWLWYYSCAEWMHYGYHTYQATPNYRYMFFMPMNGQKWHRDQMCISLAPVLDQALWSYQAQGRTLPNDISTTGVISWRAYLNEDWYNSTRFSVVAESYMRTDAWINNPQDSYENYKTEVSEKIFKPMMGRHPFIVFGSVDSLRYLHREGFETFDNLFDESYDSVLEDHARHAAATKSVLQAVDDWHHRRIGIDATTQQKLTHNHARLFDMNLVKQRVRDEIVAEILEWAEQ
jgi:hypothetical protein